MSASKGDDERDPLRRDRQADRGFFGRLAAVLRENKDLIWFCWLLFVSVGVTVTIVLISSQSSSSARQAHLVCLRSKEFGPAIATYYAEHQVLSPHALRDYITTIPKVCPE